MAENYILRALAELARLSWGVDRDFGVLVINARVQMDKLIRVAKAANAVTFIDNPLGSGGMQAELEMREALREAGYTGGDRG